MTTHVCALAQGGRDMQDPLGGRGANLSRMTGPDLPVPPGPAITTGANRAYLASGDVPRRMTAGIAPPPGPPSESGDTWTRC